jgi:purine-binding chemotaxis protein CheW
MSTLHVVFQVGDSAYLVPAESVLYMESFTGATLVPGAAPFVVGLVQIRRRVVPVVDLRIRFGLPPAAPSLGQRVIVVQVAERIVGLLVDSAREVVHVPASAIAPPPELISGQSAGFVRAVAPVSGRLSMLIDLDKVIGPDPVVPDSDPGSVKETAHAQ